MAVGEHGVTDKDLLYVRRRFITKDQLQHAIAQVVNAIFHVRLPQIWGEGITASASDSKKFGAWEQNPMTEWHVRYGGRGVMIYWQVERPSTSRSSIAPRLASPRNTPTRSSSSARAASWRATGIRTRR
jgi:TnpA family transposase